MAICCDCRLFERNTMTTQDRYFFNTGIDSTQNFKVWTKISCSQFLLDCAGSYRCDFKLELSFSTFHPKADLTYVLQIFLRWANRWVSSTRDDRFTSVRAPVVTELVERDGNFFPFSFALHDKICFEAFELHVQGVRSERNFKAVVWDRRFRPDKKMGVTARIIPSFFLRHNVAKSRRRKRRNDLNGSWKVMFKISQEKRKSREKILPDQTPFWLTLSTVQLE